MRHHHRRHTVLPRPPPGPAQGEPVGHLDPVRLQPGQRVGQARRAEHDPVAAGPRHPGAAHRDEPPGRGLLVTGPPPGDHEHRFVPGGLVSLAEGLQRRPQTAGPGVTKLANRTILTANTFGISTDNLPTVRLRVSECIWRDWCHDHDRRSILVRLFPFREGKYQDRLRGGERRPSATRAVHCGLLTRGSDPRGSINSRTSLTGGYEDTFRACGRLRYRLTPIARVRYHVRG